MKSKPNSAHIDELIERYFLGQLSETEGRELNDALKSDRELRDRFRGSADVDAELRHLASVELPGSDTQRDGQHSNSSNPIVGKSGPVRLGWLRLAGWGCAVLAATVLFAVGIALFQSEENNELDQRTADRNDLADSDPIATLTAGYREQFETEFSPDQGRFDSGDYRLSGGAITMRFRNGVMVTIEAPAQFSIVNDMRMQLDDGRAWADVPEAGHGFVIATPQIEAEDLGTEFGVVVNKEKGSELHVFAGSVKVHQQNQPPELLIEETAAAWNSRQERRQLDADYKAFATNTLVGLKKWRDHSRDLRSDPSAVFYYDFEDKEDASVVLNRSTTSSVSNGIVRGGIWATGRWPDKGALLLEGKGDRIELDIPGEYQAVTIMAWVQLNRLDEPLQAFFNTRDYDAGEHHWNLTRSGKLDVGIAGAFKADSADSLPLGQWTHIAAVIDSNNRSATYFINGQVALRSDLGSQRPLQFGACSIGAYGVSERVAPGRVRYGRELRGRIDEVAMFARAMSEQEVQNAFEAGSHF